jgi:ParG
MNPIGVTSMARKASTKKVETAVTKPVRVDLAPDVHQDFRVESAKEGISMAAMAKRLVDEWVEKRRKGRAK